MWDEILLRFVPGTGGKEIVRIHYHTSRAYPTGISDRYLKPDHHADSGLLCRG